MSGIQVKDCLALGECAHVNCIWPAMEQRGLICRRRNNAPS